MFLLTRNIKGIGLRLSKWINVSRFVFVLIDPKRFSYKISLYFFHTFYTKPLKVKFQTVFLTFSLDLDYNPIFSNPSSPIFSNIFHHTEIGYFAENYLGFSKWVIHDYKFSDLQVASSLSVPFYNLLF